MTSKSKWTSGPSSSKASSLFDLDENGNKSILVYKYRSGAKRLEVKTERDLCTDLDNDPSLPFLRVTRKPIPRGYCQVEIFTEDLLSPSERKQYVDNPSLKVSVANVALPTLAKWKHMILGRYDNLYIVRRSHIPSPEASKNNSPESS
jgi:hypothetical protein